MKNFVARVAIAAALLHTSSALAQGAMVSNHPKQTVWVLNWEIAKPVGDFSKYIEDTSFRGVSFEGRRFLKENLSLGLSFSWNRFQQTSDMESVPVTNGTASGPIYRYADMLAVRALAHLYLARGNLRPYLGGGIGGSWDYAYQQVTDLSSSQNNFDFIVSPEAGLLYAVASGGTSIGLNLAIRYTYTTATVGQYKNAQTASAIVGLTWGF